MAKHTGKAAAGVGKRVAFSGHEIAVLPDGVTAVFACSATG
ncbi:hypothetical protein [Streptomyces katrae]|nr:hypothetical protein [Streptomyces katrae]